MILVKPILEITLDVRGKKKHDFNRFADELTAYSGENTFYVCSGINKYRNSTVMGDSITCSLKRRNLKFSYKTIKGEDQRIVIFRR